MAVINDNCFKGFIKNVVKYKLINIISEINLLNNKKMLNSVKKYWKWLFIPVLLPTLNGCQPSFGYPLSLPLPISESEVSNFIDFNLFVIILAINLILFGITIKFISKYFKNNKFEFIFFLSYFLYEGVVTLLSIFFKGLGGFSTLSFWIFTLVAGIIPERMHYCDWVNGKECFNPFDFRFYAFEMITAVIVVLILLIVAKLFKKILIQSKGN